jgi:hypothetical protein
MVKGGQRPGNWGLGLPGGPLGRVTAMGATPRRWSGGQRGPGQCISRRRSATGWWSKRGGASAGQHGAVHFAGRR